MSIRNRSKREILVRTMILVERPPLMIELEREEQRISLRGGTEVERKSNIVDLNMGTKKRFHSVTMV